MSRNVILGIVGFGGVCGAGAAAHLASGNALLSIICAVGLAAGLILHYGRKWYREILRATEQQKMHLKGIAVLSGYLGGAPIHWSIQGFAPESLDLVLHILTCLNVRKVLELGSGLSTLFMAKHLKECGGGRIDSFDHEERWAAITNQNLTQRGLQDFAVVRVAPLTEKTVNGGKCCWYSLPANYAGAAYDLILADGPPSSPKTPLARLPALYELHACMTDRSVMILDDAGRDWEVEVATRWQRDFPEFHFCRLDLGRGLLVVSKNKDVFDLLPQ